MNGSTELIPAQPDELPDLVARAIKARPHQCFANAQRAVVYGLCDTYVEGTLQLFWKGEALGPAFHHAWCLHEGRLVDPTATPYVDGLADCGLPPLDEGDEAEERVYVPLATLRREDGRGEMESPGFVAWASLLRGGTLLGPEQLGKAALYDPMERTLAEAGWLCALPMTTESPRPTTGGSQ